MAKRARVVAAAWGQGSQEYTIQVVANGMHFADGPVWSLEDFLLFSDTVTDKQHKFTPGKGVQAAREVIRARLTPPPAAARTSTIFFKACST